MPASCIGACSSYLVFIRYCPLSRDDRIHPISVAILCTRSLYFDRFRMSFFFEPIFVFSSTYFFQVFFGRPLFLLPLTSRSRETLKTLSSSLLSTCPCHLTPFAVANRSIVSIDPVSPSVLRWSFCQPLSDRALLSPQLSLFSLKLLFHFLLNTMPRFHTVLLILRNNDKLYLSSSEETNFQAITLHIP